MVRAEIAVIYVWTWNILLIFPAIPVTLNESHGVSKHKQDDGSKHQQRDNLFKLHVTAMETSKFDITSPSWAESISGQWIPFTKGR